jgi:hypothetical protein
MHELRWGNWKSRWIWPWLRDPIPSLKTAWRIWRWRMGHPDVDEPGLACVQDLAMVLTAEGWRLRGARFEWMTVKLGYRLDRWHSWQQMHACCMIYVVLYVQYPVSLYTWMIYTDEWSTPQWIICSDEWSNDTFDWVGLGLFYSEWIGWGTAFSDGLNEDGFFGWIERGRIFRLGWMRTACSMRWMRTAFQWVEWGRLFWMSRTRTAFFNHLNEDDFSDY